MSTKPYDFKLIEGQELEFLPPQPLEEAPENMYDVVMERVAETLRNHPYYVTESE